MSSNEHRDTAPHINETPGIETGLQSDTPAEFGGKQRSTATNTSFETGAGEGSLGYDSPAIGSQWLKNTEVEGVDHVEPYYPPGGPSDGDTTVRDE